MFFMDSRERDTRRTLGMRDKQILYENAKGRCENPKCNKKITFVEMMPGHKTAWSRGGRTTLKNSSCLCFKCNKLQGGDSWAIFMKKLNVEDPNIKVKGGLDNLTLPQLKILATKHHIKLTGRVEESLFSSRTIAPTKRQYISKLSRVVTEAELEAVPQPAPKPVKKKPRQKTSD
jgi:hypothetical protein